MRLRFLLSCFLFLAGCAPISQYRYSGMTPAARPVAWDGYPSHAGEVHAEVSVTHTHVEENLTPDLHDTALHVAATTIEGNASITPVRGLDIGLRWSYADYAWTEQTAFGTMPLPNHPSLFGIGPEIRGALFLDHDKHFALGLAASALVYQVPWAAYQLQTGTSNYTLVNTGKDTDWTLALGIYPSYSFGPDGRYGTAFGVLGIHTSFKNDGFTDTPSSGSSITEDGFVPYAGFGYGIHTPYFHASAMLYFPVTIDTTFYGPGGMITLGVDLPLWKPREKPRAPAVDRETAPGAFDYRP
jgi:hypothetical protein